MQNFNVAHLKNQMPAVYNWFTKQIDFDKRNKKSTVVYRWEECRDGVVPAAVFYEGGGEENYGFLASVSISDLELAEIIELKHYWDQGYYYNSMKVVNCNEYITLRIDDSEDAPAKERIPLGDYVTYISEAENGFYKISYRGMEGFAKKEYLELIIYN